MLRLVVFGAPRFYDLYVHFNPKRRLSESNRGNSGSSILSQKYYKRSEVTFARERNDPCTR